MRYVLLLAVPFMIGIAVLQGLTVEIDTFHGSDSGTYQLPTILQLAERLDFSDYPSAQTPLFHVLVHTPKDALERAHAELVETRGVELFRYARTTTSPGWSRLPVTVGENAMAVEVDEVRHLMSELAATALDG